MPFRISFDPFLKKFVLLIIPSLFFWIGLNAQLRPLPAIGGKSTGSVTALNKTTTGDINLTAVSPAIIDAANSGVCITSTFFMHLTAAGQKVNIKEVQTFPDGNFLLGGNITLPNAEREGLLCTMSNSGALISQNQLRIDNKPVSIYAVKVMVNGKFFITGVLHDATEKIFVGLLNSDLSADWLKLITPPGVPSDVKMDCADNGDVFIAAKLPNAIFYTLLNVAGTQVWSRSSFPVGLNELVGLGHTDFGEISLFTNCTRTGIKVVEQTTINQLTGADITSHIIGNGTQENYFSKVTSYSNRVIFSGVKKNIAAQYQLTRNISYNSATIETQHTYTIPGIVDINTNAAMDNAGDALGFGFPSQGRFVFIRHFSAYQTAPDFTRQYSVPVGASIRSITRSLHDGGFLFAFNTADSSEFMLIKTDSIGSLPGCGFQTIANAFTETLNLQNTATGSTSGTVSAAVVSGSLSLVTAGINNTTDCNVIYCPPAPPEDSCLSTYVKLLRSNSHIDAFNSSYLMRDNYRIAVTGRNNRIWNDYKTIYGLKRFDEKGHFINGVTMTSNNENSYSFSRRISDQRIMLVHNSQIDNVQGFTFTLVDDNLQVIWSKTVKTFFVGFSYNSSSYARELVADSEGNFYYVTNNLGFMENRKVLVYKMDANGDPVWVKITDVPGGLFLASSATTTNTSLVALIEGSPRSATVRLDKTTGQLLNAYTFISNPDGSGYHRMFKFDNDRIYYGGNNLSNFTMGVFDTTGKPFRIKAINLNGTGFRAGNVKNDNFYASYQYFNGSTFKNVLFKTDSALSFLYAKEYDNEYGFAGDLDVSNEGNIYMAGNYNYGSGYYDPILIKFDSSGNLGTCSSVNNLPPVINVDFAVQSAATSSSVNIFTAVTPLTVSFAPDTFGQQISAILCSSTSLCNSLNLSGTDIICQLNQPYTYQANRNPGCNSNVSWIFDTAFAVLQGYTDTSAIFTFKMPGNTWLKAKIITGCSFIIDSMLIQIQSSPQFFSLGQDEFLCPGNTLQLHAGPGFNSYLWQDGSSDSVYTVTQPGTYHVWVRNLCGDEFRDTVIISPAIIPALDLGLDRTVCYADTLQITASPGFSSYAWQPSPLINGQGQQVFVIPLQNEEITVIATTPDGCNAYDTINITSISARPVWLGNDTSFCEKGAIILSAGAGYIQYNWSTGATGMSITAGQQGSYWVKALDANGCYAKDTLEIKQVYANPIPNLGLDFSICLNEQKILDAGNYAGYLWNTGSTNRFFTVNTPGKYWVNVTDNNNCKGSDSITLISILPLPSNFLKQADSICSYEKLAISPFGNFNNYLWSTGSTSSTIYVTSTGQYMLTVSDVNGCKGKDTILVLPKNCIRAVYIPNAFTPNRDTKNDLFRAQVYGNLTYFRLEVFNRYGELVFMTNDPAKGWDGNFKGEKQPGSAFTWHCIYQLSGRMVTHEKGTVMLIR